MDFDQHTVCEKIINEIDAVFHKDPDLCTFDIIHLPSNQNTNKSPVIHEENNLGLESWCVQHVYEYAHNTILAGTRHANFRSSRPQSPTKPAAQSTNQLLKYLNSATLINPDVSTYWNIRRKLFVKNRLNITKEFQFSTIVLSKKAKSNEAFFYRRWLFSFQSGESIDWTIELALSERCADKSASNYHAWSHRQWVLQKAPYLLKYEARLTEKFIRKHIGDYSGYNHRQHVLGKLLETGFDAEHEPTMNDYQSLRKYVYQMTATLATTIVELLALVFGDDAALLIATDDRPTHDEVATRCATHLYCLNIASYDLQLCAELQSMYGSREAFNCHRRAVLKFIVDLCTVSSPLSSSSPNPSASGSPKIDGPSEKMAKMATKRSPLVQGMQLAESASNATHRKWCALFLGFEFDDVMFDANPVVAVIQPQCVVAPV